MARNVIERVFGVLKHRFRILVLAPKYNLHVQARIPAALCTIHNFIRLHDAEEGPLPDAHGTSHASEGAHVAHSDSEHQGTHWQGANNNEMNHRRDRIAKEMWDQYQTVLHEQLGMEGLELDDVEDLDLDLEDIDSGAEDDIAA